jgi:hypothetical protein
MRVAVLSTVIGVAVAAAGCAHQGDKAAAPSPAAARQTPATPTATDEPEDLDVMQYEVGQLSGYEAKLTTGRTQPEIERAALCRAEAKAWFADPRLDGSSAGEKTSFLAGCQDALAGKKPKHDPGIPTGRGLEG